MNQTLLFDHASPDDVIQWLRGFEATASINERPGFFVFEQLQGQASFTFDCEVIEGGLNSKRSGEYFAFLCRFVEALTGQFGAVVIADC